MYDSRTDAPHGGTHWERANRRNSARVLHASTQGAMTTLVVASAHEITTFTVEGHTLMLVSAS